MINITGAVSAPKKAINFKGQLEDDYFRAAKAGDAQGQLDALNNLSFDISETDFDTKANFLHFAMKSRSDAVINQALLLIGRKAKADKTAAETVLSQRDSEGKTPYEYISNSHVINLLQKMTGIKMPVIEYQTALQTEKPKNTPAPKLNELPQGSKIDIPVLDDDDDDIFIKPSAAERPKEVLQSSDAGSIDMQPMKLEDIAGHKKAKSVLLEKLVNPLLRGRNVSSSGFLLHDTVGNGKTFLLNAAAASLNRQIIDMKLFDETIDDLSKKSAENKEKYNKKLQELFSEYIIQVSNIQDLEKVIELARKNYKFSGKQAVIFVDEIKAMLPDIGAAYSQEVTKTEQLIENSAKKGFVLVSSTRDKAAIKPESIRYGRFDEHIELRPPDKEERKEIFSKYYNGNYPLADKDIETIAKLTSGFTYINLIEFLSRADYSRISSLDSLISSLMDYAVKNELGELTEQGTTACYDRPEFKRAKVSITFKDIAGMKKIKDTFQEELIDKFKPEKLAWFKKQNRPPLRKGFLLYGPPGTGKTYITEALAGEMKLPMYKLDSSSFQDKFVGESERRLKAIFDQLRIKFEETGEYSILFIDEAESILGRRDNANNYDNGIVNIFLQYLNEAPKNGIIPIAATNYREKLDDAVLSRLGVQIKAPFPDDELRIQLINLEMDKAPEFTQNIPQKDRTRLAGMLGGFSSRDITNIVTDVIDKQTRPVNIDDFIDYAGEFAASRGLPRLGSKNRTSGYDTVIKRKEIEYPANFDDIAGMENVKKQFRELLIDRLKPEAVQKLKADGNNSPIQSNFLLYGPAGTGKTFIASAIAGEMGIPLYIIDSSVIKNKFIGESEKMISAVFEQLEDKFKETDEYSILFIDEADDLLGSREEASSHDSGLVDLFLQKMHKSAQRGIITIAATNHRNSIDSAVLSRLGEQIEISLPDEKLRKAIVEKILKERKSAANISEESIKTIVQLLSGFSSRDISYIIPKIIDKQLLYSELPLSIADFEKGINEYKCENRTE